MRLQDRVLAQMRKDTESEHDEVRKVVISRETDPKQFVRETMARLEKSRVRFADIELMFQIFFCRYYDNFELFLEELMTDIARRDPKVVDGIRLRKADDILAEEEKFEKRLEKIARLPLGQLIETISDEMSFKLFVDHDLSGRIRYSSDVRNLLTHRYGIVDRHFFERHPAAGLTVGTRFVVTMEFIRDALLDMSSAAADIQKRAQSHFGLHYETLLVGHTEWWEEPDNRLPELPPPSNPR